MVYGRVVYWEEAFYDSVLRVTECREEDEMVTGVEYVLSTEDMVEGRLGLAWDPEGGGPVTGPIGKVELLSPKKDALHPIVTLRREKKGRSTANKPELKPEEDKRESLEEWWLPVGCPVRELTFNPAM